MNENRLEANKQKSLSDLMRAEFMILKSKDEDLTTNRMKLAQKESEWSTL